jgi:hypothetical protein
MLKPSSRSGEGGFSYPSRALNARPVSMRFKIQKEPIMRHALWLPVFFILVLDLAAQTPIQMEARIGYWPCSVHSTIDLLDNSTEGWGHYIVPGLQFSYKSLHLRGHLIRGGFDAKFRNHYSYFSERDVDYAWEVRKFNTRISFTEFWLALGYSFTPHITLFGVLTNRILSFTETVDYVEYRYSEDLKTWEEVGEDTGSYHWERKQNMKGISLEYFYYLIKKRLAIRSAFSYFPTVKESLDLMILNAGLEFDLIPRVKIFMDYRADFLGLDNVEETQHGVTLGILWNFQASSP